VTDAPAVVDASALLALVLGERITVAPDAFVGGIMSAVNLTEALTKMVDAGATAVEAMADVEALGLDLEIVNFDRGAAIEAAGLRSRTKRLGLSLGDRACLATARSRSLRVLTADRAWSKLDGFEIVPVR
jgi:PIN domain nuclease of toxin-antitoxin system